ncbi:MAG: hypothetical protein KatS3mg029_0174 [Saprospiraceae bacterium]|nr:MAG: hypothetical protein KatS3mg029_0174 [Saprospiraceae bacterium]
MLQRIAITCIAVCTGLVLWAQNPHGERLRMDCAACHSPQGWEIPASHWAETAQLFRLLEEGKLTEADVDTSLFHHGKTGFSLTGQHAFVDCRDCHESLVFSEAQSTCVSCHTDVHQNTVGSDCARCHTTDNWLVDDIAWLHEQEGFALIGVHAAVSCAECHTSESRLRFDRIGNDCAACHLDDFDNTTNPNHRDAGFSTNCLECHDTETPDWTTDAVDHSFFPLEKGHAINDCAACHTGGSFANTPTDCFACHQTHFENTLNPDHESAGFSHDCASCHTIDPGWSPAQYTAHDGFFPIYSGAHAGTWDACASCHTDGSDFSVFSCTICHTDPTTSDAHQSVNGYVYENSACLACHPTGDVENIFDHSLTAFPLTGAHLTTACTECHASGYAGTPTACEECHTEDFNQTNNPSHVNLGLSKDCATCHTTEPGWKPATFDIHNDFYALNGAHAAIANECATCHNGDYNNTPNTCYGCHQADYEATTNPNHLAANFDTDCAACHSESGWVPANFDHDGQFFPIYSGKHEGEWSQCTDCHINPSNYAEFSCIVCHTDPQTSQEHQGVSGYVFENSACLACHPTGDAENIFDHNLTAFPLTGAHVALECTACHSAGYAGTPTACEACHLTDYQQSANPSHTNLGLPTDCASCHTTEPGWAPASFDIHNDFYALTGAHAAIANECATCHNGDYNNTPNTCYGCHQADYAATTDPDHETLLFSTDCASCHTEDVWVPSTFDHDGQFFPIYSGAHAGQWFECFDCHTNPGNYAQFSCTNCHINPETDDAHVSVGGYVYENSACLACHPTGDADNVFDHNMTDFPLTGAHLNLNCLDCHAGGYAGTPIECAACHLDNFNATSNPDHNALALPTDCAQCHTTEPGWAPAAFPIHDDVWPLEGAHGAVANDCAACHNGNYTDTPSECVGCHEPDYNAATNPDHASAQFPKDCAFCHEVNAWSPSSFHHDDYFALTGAHAAIADDCVACHNGSYDDTPSECVGCHQAAYDQTTNPNHVNLALPTDCAQCHTTEPGWAPAAFPIHDDFYVLQGAHAAIADDCAACHNGNYNDTPTDCFGCHEADYNSTTNPNHAQAQFNTDCVICHNEDAWVPSTFDHDAQYFPIYSGKHEGEWSECVDCHTNPNNFAEFSCTVCHLNPETDDEHQGVTGYVYVSSACLACHPTGSADDNFNHDNTGFPLTGAHTALECLDCHANGFSGTPSDCVACHETQFNNTTNPDHVALGLPTSCDDCHTTEPGWAPATFAIHDQFWELTGAHAEIANECAACHAGNYNSTPNTCVGCHQSDYDESANPSHVNLALPSSCDDCHTTEPGWAPAAFPIHDDFWPLLGAHASISDDCAACHGGNYNNTPNTCVGCHQDDYNQTTDPNHVVNQYPTDCTICHDENAWSPSSFDHDQFWPLTGAHATIADDCVSCHAGNYQTTPNTCVGCHQSDYDESSNPNHVNLALPTTCDDCHTTEPGWAPAAFPIHDDFWVLDGAHAAIADDCAACHAGNYNNTPNTCFGCHDDDYNATTNPDHVTNQYPTDCQDCHTTSAWTPSTFDHSQFWPFQGAHVAIANDCNACHGGNYQNTPNTCYGCHDDDYNATTNPDHVAANFPTDCEQCHTQNAWTPSSFDHNQFWPLTGAHQAIATDCNACHGGNYQNTPNTCDGCHMDDYNQTTNPNHVNLALPTTCDDCHTTEPGWAPAAFPIHDNYWVLDGAHADIADDCAACHNGNYNNTPNTCDGCHMDDYNQSTNPNHVNLALPTTCDDCHTTEPGWAPAAFPIHNNYWVLEGAHADIADDCFACHAGNYNNTPNTCDGCHMDDYNQSTNPNHVALGIPTDCAQCHTTEPGWAPAAFPIHNNYWVLDGAHADIADDCAACHNGNYNNTPNTCDGCHMDDYNQSTNPNHVNLALPTTCDDCHTTEPGWAPAAFPIHNNYWVIDGAHLAIADDCAACHQGNYNNTPNTCDGCHIDDYNQTSNPNHVALNLPIDCDMCHTTEPGWAPATFPIHNQFWPLNGAHAAIQNDCVLCHNGNYNNTPNTCYGCHADDYNMATNPNHAANQLPTDCEECHTETAWVPSTFTHAFWPMTGAHIPIANDCNLCHQGNYNNTPNQCEDCHMPAYNSATNPNHVALNLPTDCAMCHTTDPDWMPATFPIHNQFWPLNGAHAAIANDCVLCHNGNYNNTPNTCYGCHASEYNNATNPNHAAAGFPTDCQLCHTETAWVPSTFDHDNMYFPIYSGTHEGEWNLCTDCHIGGNYNTFSCIDCHEHDDPVELEEEHEGVPGYQYNSQACYNCHPTGEN